MRLSWVRVGPKYNDRCSYKREKRRRHEKRRRSCEDGDRGRGYTATSQGMLRIASSHQELGGRHGTDSPSATWRKHFCRHLDFGLPALRLQDKCISVVLSHASVVIYYSRTRKQIHPLFHKAFLLINDFNLFIPWEKRLCSVFYLDCVTESVITTVIIF